MADRTISQLLEVVNPNTNDVLPVVNGGITKKVSINNMVGASTFSTRNINNLEDAAPNLIDTLQNPDNEQFVIQSSNQPFLLRKLRVSNIYPVGVSTSTIDINFNVNNRNLTASVRDGSINQTHLGVGVVETGAIADGAITEQKIDPNAKIGGATGAGPDKVFYLNDQAVTTNFTVPAGQNAMSAGPVTINTGVTVTVPPGCTWTVV
jgi:hypothetical protein